MDVLKRFITILDYQRNEVYVKPNTLFNPLSRRDSLPAYDDHCCDRGGLCRIADGAGPCSEREGEEMLTEFPRRQSSFNGDSDTVRKARMAGGNKTRYLVVNLMSHLKSSAAGDG